MMNPSKLVFSLALATAGMLGAPTLANAASFTTLPGFTDLDFEQMRTEGEFTELFVAETRIGNNRFDGDRELGINTGTGTPVHQGQDQRIWTSGDEVDFILEYTGSLVNYTVGGRLLTSDDFSGPVTDIFLRTRATSNSEMSFTNLLLDGMAIDDLVSSTLGTSDSKDVDYIQISDLSTPFTLTGTYTKTWTSSRAPRNSHLASQIKVGTTPPDIDTNPNENKIPEPSMVLALTVGAGALGLMKRKN